MSNWLVAVFFGVSIAISIGCASASAQDDLQPATAEVTNGNVVYGFTAARLWATMAAVVGLISAIIGGLSLARSAGRFGTGSGQRGAIVAAVMALIAIVYAGLHLANFNGDFGTGSGRAGAIVAIVMGLTGLVLAGLTFARSRRGAGQFSPRPSPPPPSE